MLITFEGIDGCGKSTQIRMLDAWMEENNYPCIIFREPGGADLPEKIRELLLDAKNDMDPVTELLLFSAARSQLISEKVVPLLNRGYTVILDRFYDSTTAYQGYGRESASLEEIHSLNRLASHNCVPDLTFYLKISYADAGKRTESSEKDRIERAGQIFFEKVIRGFDELAGRESRIHTLDATLSPDDIHRSVTKTVRSHLSV